MTNEKREGNDQAPTQSIQRPSINTKINIAKQNQPKDEGTVVQVSKLIAAIFFAEKICQKLQKFIHTIRSKI